MSELGGVGVAAFLEGDRVGPFFAEEVLDEPRILRRFSKFVPFVEPRSGVGRALFSRHFALLTFAFAFISAFVLLFVVDE